MSVFVSTATDTDVGKTVFAAALLAALSGAGRKASYWKPVQSGVEGVDTKTVQRLTGLPDDRFLPERYVFAEPLSPHRAAEIDGVAIDPGALDIPSCPGTLLIEGAGGLMVPLTRAALQIDLFARWRLPVILCARTALGTINHTLLSVEALRMRDIPLHGIAFVGEDNPDTIRTITGFSGARVLGRLPWMETLNAQNLVKSFKCNFRIQNFVIPSQAEGSSI